MHNFFLHLWQEMLMENICNVNEAHHRIVWQLAMALPEEIQCKNKLAHWHEGCKLYHPDQAVQQGCVYFKGWQSLVICGFSCSSLCQLAEQASHLGPLIPRLIWLWLHMHWSLYTCFVQDFSGKQLPRLSWKPCIGFAEGWQMALAYTMVSHSE